MSKCVCTPKQKLLSFALYFFFVESIVATFSVLFFNESFNAGIGLLVFGTILAVIVCYLFNLECGLGDY